jgi:hypothetical protein
MDVGSVPSGSPSDGIDRERLRGVQAMVILPTLNEEEGLARTLERLPLVAFTRSGEKIGILVVDGGSTDGTLAVARAWDIPVLRQKGRGKGGAMVEAISWVHALGIPYVIVLDADATYPPDRILPALALLRGGTDLVIGVRRPVWGAPTDYKDLVHRVGNLALSSLATLLSRRPILDLCSGFWAVSTERFMALGLEGSQFAIEAELVLKSIRQSSRIDQIPVDYSERVGHAKLRALRDGSRIFLTVLREARPAPVRIPGRSVSPPAVWAPQTAAAHGASPPLPPATSLQLSAPRTLRPLVMLDSPHTSPSLVLRSGGLPVPVAGPSTPASRRYPGYPLGQGSERATGPAPTLGTGDPGPSPTPPSFRPLVLELFTDSNEGEERSAEAQWSRSGGLRRPALPLRLRSPSLLVLTSRLNFQPHRREQALLAANGFRMVEMGAEAGASAISATEATPEYDALPVRASAVQGSSTRNEP